MSFAVTQMDLLNVILSEVSHTEKEKYCMAPLICGILKEMIQMNLLTKQKSRLREGAYGLPVGRMRGRDSYGAWDGHVYTAIFKMDNQ